MENSLADNIFRVCNSLNKFSVEYMIVGGTAVALHGYYRPSKNDEGQIGDKPDLDFWYNPTYENYFKLLSALEDLGQDVTKFKEEQTPNPRRSFFKYELETFTLDFLPELKAPLRFRSAYKRRETINLGDTEIPFINYEDLILDKKAEARPKDMDDVEQLIINRKNKQ